MAKGGKAGVAWPYTGRRVSSLVPWGDFEESETVDVSQDVVNRRGEGGLGRRRSRRGSRRERRRRRGRRRGEKAREKAKEKAREKAREKAGEKAREKAEKKKVKKGRR